MLSTGPRSNLVTQPRKDSHPRRRTWQHASKAKVKEEENQALKEWLQLPLTSFGFLRNSVLGSVINEADEFLLFSSLGISSVLRPPD
ncbi:hypothetical protein C0J52_10583 [Blattella germanica]|nr:hypothetical protein C0J52_10583 [Blattella germanica]